jgi:predicted ABC-type ATPase
LRFVNADIIAAEHWPGEEAAHAYAAARIAADERTRLVGEGASFATETVFSHPSKLNLIREALDAGYLVTLHVVLVPEELAVARVENRVEHGGHTVPEDKVRARYARLWGNVVEAIALVPTAIMYDNSVANDPLRVVASFRDGRLGSEPNWPAWTPAELRAMPHN